MTLKIHPGAAWAAMAAEELQRDPAFAKLAACVGPEVAQRIAITAAGQYWNAHRTTSAPPDQVRRGAAATVEIAPGMDADPQTLQRIDDALAVFWTGGVYRA